MLYSSPRTRSFKVFTPVLLFVACTLSVAWVQRNDIRAEPVTTVFLLLALYGAGSWVLWRPFRLGVADVVEDRNGQLHIRRGAVEVSIPYSGVVSHEYLQIGRIPGMKLVFREPNALGGEIGFYTNGEVDTSVVPSVDPLEMLERALEKARQGRAA